VDYAYARLPSWAGLALLRCARWSGKPYLVSLHGDWGEILAGYARGARRAAARCYYRAAARHVRPVVRRAMRGAAHSFVVGDRLRERYAPAGAAVTVYHDSTHRASDVWPLRPVFRQPPLRVLFVGELAEAKGADVLARAVARLRAGGLDARAVFAGEGPLGGWLRDEAPRLGARVDVRGWVSHGAEFDALFTAADVLVLPSRTEGVPRVIVEAMARATPVVATPVGDVPELLAHGDRGWLAPVADDAALAATIDRVRMDADDRARRVANAREFARQRDVDHWRRVIREAIAGIDPGLALPHEVPA
jgi:glycosyltransferase involved in cell wall biosynthesis